MKNSIGDSADGLFNEVQVNAFPMDGNSDWRAAVPLATIFEYALFFRKIDLFAAIPRPNPPFFEVYLDDRFAWENANPNDRNSKP